MTPSLPVVGQDQPGSIFAVGAGVSVNPASVARPSPTSEFPSQGQGWVRTWLRTAAVGTLLLVVIFSGYEVLERAYLEHHFSAKELWRFHLLRGMGASILLGSLAVYRIWRARRQYDAMYASAYRTLQTAMEERSRTLARTQSFTERLLDALRDRIVVLDGAGEIVKANRVALEALGNDLHFARCCSQFGCTPGPDCVAQVACKTRMPVVGREVMTDSKTGRIYSVDAYPVDDADAANNMIIVVARDITEAKNLEAQLSYHEKLAALGVLAAGIAHDIGNPLASMSSELELMERERDLPRLHESVVVLRGQIGRITRTLHEMNDFARRRGDEVTEIPIDVAVEDAMRMVRHDPRARRLKLVVDVGPGLRPLRGVEDHLVMVLVNLVINAFDAIPNQGTVAVRARSTPSGDITVEVTDDGQGMTEEVQRRALEPLFTTKARGHGTGLGLSVSVDIVTAMGGTLTLESSPGLGTTVRLSFPASAVPSSSRFPSRLVLGTASDGKRAELTHG